MKKVVLDSRHGSGPAYDKLYVAPIHVVRCTRPTQRIEVEVAYFRASYTWQSVNVGNNAFTLTADDGTARHVVLAPGNYDFGELADAITDGIGLDGTVIEYDRPHNKLRFKLPSPMTLSFDNASYGILGFAPTDVIHSSDFESTTAINLSPIDVAWVHLEDVGLAGDGCLANTGGELKASSVLALLPIETAPFSTISYTAAPADIGLGLAIVERQLRSFRIAIRDGNGAPLLDFPDYTLCLRVRVVDAHLSNMDASLDAIRTDVHALTDMFGAEFVTRNMEGALEHFAHVSVSPDVEA